MAGEEGKDGKWREEKEQDIQALSEELPFIQASGGTTLTTEPDSGLKLMTLRSTPWDELKGQTLNCLSHLGTHSSVTWMELEGIMLSEWEFWKTTNESK